jgi:sugar diacid utilization regulator
MASALQALVDELADRIGRAVMIDDKHGRAEVYSALQGHADPLRLESILRREVPAEALAWAATLGIDTAPGAVRTPANPAVGAESRVAIPLRHEGVLLGRLTVLDPNRDLPADSVRAAERAAAEAARLMHHDQLVQAAARGRERELLRDLIAEDAGLRRHAEAALREEGLLAAGRVTAMMVVRYVAPDAQGSPDWPAALDHAVERLRRRVAPGHALGLVRFNQALALVVASDPAALAERAGQLRQGAAEASGEEAVVGIGGAIAHLADAPASLRQAQHAARVAAHVPRFGGLAAWDALGAYRALTGMAPDGELDRELLDPALLRLLDADPRGTLVHTLETYLDLAGDAQATARRLVLHRAGLYYRLGRIREITGLDLKDGEARLGIHLSIKLARLGGVPLG